MCRNWKPLGMFCWTIFRTWGTIGMSECFVNLSVNHPMTVPSSQSLAMAMSSFFPVFGCDLGHQRMGSQRKSKECSPGISLKFSLKLNLKCSDHVKTGLGMLDILRIHTRSGKSRGYSPLVVQEVNGISRRTLDYSSFIFLSKNDDIWSPGLKDNLVSLNRPVLSPWMSRKSLLAFWKVRFWITSSSTHIVSMAKFGQFFTQPAGSHSDGCCFGKSHDISPSNLDQLSRLN